MALIVVLVVAVSAFAYLSYESGNSTPAQTTLLLDFRPTYNHFPYYYGLDHGIYSNNGIDLTVEPGSGDSGAVSALAAGSVPFALANVPGLLFALQGSNITNVRVVAIVFQRTFFSIMYNTARVTTLSDIQGKTGGANSPSTSYQTLLFYLLLKLNGISLDSLNMQYAGSSVTAPLLAQGSIDFALRPIDSLGDVQAAASQNNITIGDFPFEAYGLDTYGVALLTTQQMIQSNPDLVQRMVLATMQSVVGAVQDPSGAAASLVKYQPQLNETKALEGIKLLISCCMQNATANTDPLAYGWVSPSGMQHAVSLVAEGSNMTSPPDPTSLYSDAFTHQP